jgi:hypothetical protein
MTRVVHRNGQWIDRRTKEPVPDRKRAGLCAPMVVSDLPAYKSPLGDGVIEGRYARREHLKRNNCREVDPSEFRPVYKNERFAKKYGLPYTPD